MTNGVGTAAIARATTASPIPPAPMATKVQTLWRDNLFEGTYANNRSVFNKDFWSRTKICTAVGLFATGFMVSWLIAPVLALRLAAISALAILTLGLKHYLQYERAVQNLKFLDQQEAQWYEIRNLSQDKTNRVRNEAPRLMDVVDEGMGYDMNDAEWNSFYSNLLSSTVEPAKALSTKRANHLLEFNAWQMAWDDGKVNKVMLLIGKEQQMRRDERILQAKALISEEKHPLVEEIIKNMFVSTTAAILEASVAFRIDFDRHKIVGEAAFAKQAHRLYQSTQLGVVREHCITLTKILQSAHVSLLAKNTRNFIENLKNFRVTGIYPHS